MCVDDGVMAMMMMTSCSKAANCLRQKNRDVAAGFEKPHHQFPTVNVTYSNMAASANLQSVPAVIRSEQGGSFFRRTTSCLSFNRVPFLEAGMGGSVPCSCVIEIHGHPGTGKSFTLSEMAVEALVSCGSTASADQRTVLWFDADLKFNPDCVMKCAKRASSASGCTLAFDELLSRILVFKPSDVLQLVATLQGMRLGADLGTFPDIGIPIMVIVDGVSPLFVSSRAAGDATHSMFDQVPRILKAGYCFKRLPYTVLRSLLSSLVPYLAAVAATCQSFNVAFWSHLFQ